MNNRRKKQRQFDAEKIFSVVASIAIVAALVIGVVSIVKSTTSDKNKNYIDLNIADNETTTEEETTTKKVAEAETTEPITQAAVVQTEQGAPVNSRVYSFGEASSLLWPVKGEIVIGYNMTNTIYFPTLNQYKTSPAVCISSDAGTNVLSAAPGIVTDIYFSKITGTTMKVSIGNGYELIYGQLGNLTVGVDSPVEAGTVLATVAERTKYFSKEGNNLYFGITHDGNPVDPLTFFVEE